MSELTPLPHLQKKLEQMEKDRKVVRKGGIAVTVSHQTITLADLLNEELLSEESEDMD